MDDKTIEKNDVIEIDLQRVFSAIWSRIWLVMLVSPLGAAL